MKVVTLAGLLTFIACVSLASQQNGIVDPPTLRVRSEANYIEVDAYVTDDRGMPIHGLTAADFELLDDNMKRDVEVFDEVHLPDLQPVESIARGGLPDVDVRTNRDTAGEGRVYLIVLDDLHVAQTYAKRVKTALQEFVARAVGPRDLAAVVYTSGRSTDGQEFTNSIRLLRRAIDNFTGVKLRSATVERLQDVGLNRGGTAAPNADPFQVERAQRARTTLATLQSLGTVMTQVTGRRKTMILVSEGVDYDVTEGPAIGRSTQWSVNADLKNAVGALNRGNVAIYALDPRGVTSGTEGLIDSSSLFEQQGVGVGAAQRELRESHSVLEALSANTGGATLLWRTNSAPGFERVARESGSYYLLGYHAPAAQSNSYRRIEVRVRRPGARVRARNGYFANPPESSAVPELVKGLPIHLARAIASPLPLPQLPLSIVAVPYQRQTTSMVAVVIEVDVSNGTRADTAMPTLDVVLAAVDRQGRVRKVARQTVPLQVAQADSSARPHVLQLSMEVDLPPAAYQLHVAASTSASSVGSVSYDVDVPDYSKDDLSISGLSLTTSESMPVHTAIADGVDINQWPGPLNTRRDFDRGNTLIVRADIYTRRQGSTSNSVTRVQLRSLDGSVVTDAAAIDIPASSSVGRRVMGELPLTVGPGRYVVHVETRAGRSVVTRDIPVRVQ